MSQQFGGENRDSGMGNIHRSNEEIYNDIVQRILDDPFLRSQDVRVSVSAGIVTLEGTVASPMARDLAHDIVSNVPGVREVQDQLETGVIPARPESSVGPEATGNRDSVGDMSMSDTPNIPVVNEHVMKGDEVAPFTEEAAIQNTDVPIPQTGSDTKTVNRDGAFPADEVRVTELDEDSLSRVLQKDMPVVDVNGKKVGNVKEVRSTDFLLHRLLHRDYYVPYLACTFDGQNVVVNVQAEEIGNQGWAEPHSI